MSDPNTDDRVEQGSTANSSELEGELLSRLELIESQPLDQRADGYDQLAAELEAELQRSDSDEAVGT